MRHTPSSYYSNIYNTIPPPPLDTNPTKHIHTFLTHKYLTHRPPNTLISRQPPEISPDEQLLNRRTRVLLSQLRSGHSHTLQAYKYRIKQSHSPQCLRCGRAPDDTEHLLLTCETITQERRTHNITSVEDLWARPTRVADFLSAAGILH